MSDMCVFLIIVVCQAICNFIHTTRIDRLERELEEYKKEK